MHTMSTAFHTRATVFCWHESRLLCGNSSADIRTNSHGRPGISFRWCTLQCFASLSCDTVPSTVNSLPFILFVQLQNSQGKECRGTTAPTGKERFGLP